MAARKQAEDKEQVTEPQPQPAAEEKSAGKMVKVKNLGRYFFRQPSTGIRIAGKGTAELRDDAWLQLQVSSGLMEKV